MSAPITGDGWTQDPKASPPIKAAVDGWTEAGARAAGWYQDSPAPVTILSEAAKTGLSPGIASTVLGAFSYGKAKGEEAVSVAKDAVFGFGIKTVAVAGLLFVLGLSVYGLARG